MTATYEEAIQPLLDAYGALEADVKEREAELAKLRDERNRLRTALRTLAPERLPEQPQAKKNGHKKPSGTPNPDTANAVLEFARAHTVGPFTMSELRRIPGYPGPSEKGITRVMSYLHETGAIRLVARTRGGGRLWEVIR